MSEEFMTPGEAARILEEAETDNFRHDPERFIYAYEMGIEALKEKQEARKADE